MDEIWHSNMNQNICLFMICHTALWCLNVNVFAKQIFYTDQNRFGNMDRWQINVAEQTYGAKHEFPDHAQNEVGPEYVQTEENHQHHIEEIVAKEGGVMVDGVNPGTVDQPETQQMIETSEIISSISTCKKYRGKWWSSYFTQWKCDYPAQANK